MAFQAPLGPIFGKFYSDEKLMNFQVFFVFARTILKILSREMAEKAPSGHDRKICFWVRRSAK
jgi:hypothetical protein